jgi:hypothetical protein
VLHVFTPDITQIRALRIHGGIHEET